MSQALATTRFAHAEIEDELEMELSSEIDEDDEDHMELLQLIEEGGVKGLALGDWARNRILEGHWLSPADQWYENKSHPVRAVHLCPWAIETGPERGRGAFKPSCTTHRDPADIHALQTRVPRAPVNDMVSC
ncbi:hypothetical protein L218DRAFT_1006947 [Marasmius fiardii PR-910]|nr:hypothetical protein L218DRAFT_1006947 [Marasmius fiardii PR-910]